MKNIIKTIIASLSVITLLATGGAVLNSTAASAQIDAGLNTTKNAAAPTSNTQNLNNIIVTVINVLLFLIGAIAVIMLIFGGIRYTTSAGNANAVTSAKNTILYSIVGLVIAIFAYAIVAWITDSLT